MCPTQGSDEDAMFDRTVDPHQVESMSFVMVDDGLELGYQRRQVKEIVEARRSSFAE